MIETGDRSGEGTVWGEINLMRYASEVNSPNLMLMKGEDRLAMLEYGSVSPIGGAFLGKIPPRTNNDDKFH